MKKNSFLAVVAAITFVFSSCSSEEVSPLDNNQTSLLKSYKIKRDATGAYSVEFDVNENTKIDKLVDASQNKSEYLLSSSDIKTKEDFSHALLIDNDQLKVSIVDANTNQKSSISVIDDNIQLQRKGNSEMLAGYSVQGNEAGTFNLEFDVNDNVAVSFVYNETISTYEIHLEEGSSDNNSFSRTLEKEAGEPLKIDFVNHVNNPNAKSTELAMITRKPEVIIN
tara:strand:+ start:19030 stop:19701 length:672 start_codon:yes stop_codon:yes gene_type:complete